MPLTYNNLFGLIPAPRKIHVDVWNKKGHFSENFDSRSEFRDKKFPKSSRVYKGGIAKLTGVFEDKITHSWWRNDKYSKIKGKICQQWWQGGSEQSLMTRKNPHQKKRASLQQGMRTETLILGEKYRKKGHFGLYLAKIALIVSKVWGQEKIPTKKKVLVSSKVWGQKHWFGQALRHQI